MLLASPSVCWRPPCRLPCGPIEWRGAVCAVMSCLWIGYGTLHCPTPFRIVRPPFSLCVCCHSIVGLGLCLCDRVVSLWNNGDDLCGAEGRVVSTVHCQLFMCVACVSGWCACCLVVVCCGLWNGGGLVACLPLLSVFLFLFLFVGGVRGSARAAMRARTLSPNTIVFSCCLLVLSSPLLAFLHYPPFLLSEWRCVIHHVSVCCVGMTAMGSLSRSSSFFW